jgi:hypothetical protein
MSAKMLKGAKEDNEWIQDSAISIGTNKNMKDERESPWPLNTDDRFWPIKTRYATAPPHWDMKMRNSVR